MMHLGLSAAICAGAIAQEPTSRDQKGSHAVFKPDANTQETSKKSLGPGPNGLVRTPPMGWMSWEIFRCETDCSAHSDSCIDHNLYEKTADALVEGGYLAAGYDQVSIDDCWEDVSGRDSNGMLVPDSSRFPSGMKALGDYMHSKGVRFGTYSDEGTKTCGGYPGTKDHEDDDAKTFASWGVDYLKLDGCYNDQSGYVTGYPAAGAALQATGRNISYSCSWPAYLGSDESLKPFDAMIQAGCNLWRNWDDIQCQWSSLSSIIDHWGDYAAALQPWAGPGHWHDMDMLLIGNGCVTIDEEKTQMAIWSISASPLIMGNDLRSVSEESKAILLNQDAIAVSQDPLGKMGIRHPSYNSSSRTQVWYRELVNGDVAVALYNARGASHPAIPGAPCGAWNKTAGGYLEACGGSAGNVGSFSGLTLEQAQDACCDNTKCAGFSFSSGGSGYYKGNQDCGTVSNAQYTGFSKPSQMPFPSQSADITFDLTQVGFASDATVEVYDIWAQRTIAAVQGTFVAKDVPFHGSAFIRLSTQVLV